MDEDEYSMSSATINGKIEYNAAFIIPGGPVVPFHMPSYPTIEETKSEVGSAQHQPPNGYQTQETETAPLKVKRTRKTAAEPKEIDQRLSELSHFDDHELPRYLACASCKKVHHLGTYLAEGEKGWSVSKSCPKCKEKGNKHYSKSKEEKDSEEEHQQAHPECMAVHKKARKQVTVKGAGREIPTEFDYRFAME